MSDVSVQTVSIVIPVKDEARTIEPLFMNIVSVVAGIHEYQWETIWIDDGSSDDSWARMCRLESSCHVGVKVVKLRRNFGKAVALAAGFREAQGSIIFTMDADLQDDPREIPFFLKKLAEGYDLVSGWKHGRKDPLSKTFPSRIFNVATAVLTGIRLHDFNCGFKVYRREVLACVKLYGELHRYIPVLAYDLGFRVGEICVHHNPREYGVSKYGWERYTRGFLDLLTVFATTRYLQKPGHLFGGVGITSGLVGGVVLLYLTFLWFIGAGPIGTRPLFFLGILLVILSVQLVSLGILAELVVRNTDGRSLDTVIAEIKGNTSSPSTGTA